MFRIFYQNGSTSAEFASPEAALAARVAGQAAFLQSYQDTWQSVSNDLAGSPVVFSSSLMNTPEIDAVEHNQGPEEAAEQTATVDQNGLVTYTTPVRVTLAAVPTIVAYELTTIRGTCRPFDAPIEVVVNGVSAGSTRGVNGYWEHTFIPTPSMVGSSVTLAVTASGVTRTTQAVQCFDPLVLGASLGGWWNETSAYDASGWAPVSGGATMTSAALPTTGSRYGRRTIVTDGASTFVKAALTRVQPTETWLAGQCVGGPPAATGMLFSGNASNCYLAWLPGGNMRIYAGTSVTCTPTASPANRWAVYGARFNGASSMAWDNGTLMGSGDPSSTNPNGISFGASGSGVNFQAVEGGDFLFTVGILTDAQRALLVRYMTAKWL